jgi:hypothetical protein
MAIFWRLVLGHFIADFTFQTNWLAAMKRSKMWGMLLHSAIHPLTFIILTNPFLNDYWINTSAVRLNGWACIVVLFLSHFLQDQWRVFTIQHFGTNDGTLHFFWDQVVHFGAIVAVFPWKDIGSQHNWYFWFPERWVLIGILAVIVTHFTTVLIYFLEKDMWGGVYPGDDEKYLTMAERSIQAGMALLPGWWWVGGCVAWLAAGAYARRARLLEFPWFGFALGGAIATAAGLGVRLLLP